MDTFAKIQSMELPPSSKLLTGDIPRKILGIRCSFEEWKPHVKQHSRICKRDVMFTETLMPYRRRFINDLASSEIGMYPEADTLLLDVVQDVWDRHQWGLFITPQYKVFTKFTSNFCVTLQMHQNVISYPKYPRQKGVTVQIVN